MKKFVAYIIAFIAALFCAAMLLSPAIAGAESNTVDYYGVVDNSVPVTFNGEVCWKTDVYIIKTGDIFSYYDDMKLRLGSPLRIKISNDKRILNVEYLRDPKEILLMIIAVVLFIVIVGTAFYIVNKKCP